MRSAFAEKFRGVYTRSGRTLRELQQTMFVSDSALSRYMSGQAVPPWPVVAELCRICDADPADLRAEWVAARGTRRRPADGPPPDMRQALARHIATIDEAARAAARILGSRDAPAAEHLVTVRRAAADATRLLTLDAQPPSIPARADTDGGTKK
ncbi:helix-turn-helix domain-containing protein [Actinoplanes sp. NPDC020271]|uniref:helix-turn-helix domain-containing protein n=1 Tax=Actinoplanes sp. NPDC020271 TaxID=3363896 RepID=UPI0037AA7E15